MEEKLSQYSIVLENLESVIPCISLFGSHLKAYSIAGNESTDDVDFGFKTKLSLEKVQETLYESGANLESLKKEW